MANSSRRVVLAALAGNGAIALAKFAAAGISGSTAMLTEAIHSLVDTADQVLLLVGQARGEKPADATHPLGYGMEVYFWSFVVALMVFLVGGVLSSRGFVQGRPQSGRSPAPDQRSPLSIPDPQGKKRQMSRSWFEYFRS